MAQWLSRYQPQSLGENPGTVPALMRKSGGDFRACSRATVLKMGFTVGELATSWLGVWVGLGNNVHVSCNLKSVAKQTLGRLKRPVQK